MSYGAEVRNEFGEIIFDTEYPVMGIANTQIISGVVVPPRYGEPDYDDGVNPGDPLDDYFLRRNGATTPVLYDFGPLNDLKNGKLYFFDCSYSPIILVRGLWITERVFSTSSTVRRAEAKPVDELPTPTNGYGMIMYNASGQKTFMSDSSTLSLSGQELHDFAQNGTNSQISNISEAVPASISTYERWIGIADPLTLGSFFNQWKVALNPNSDTGNYNFSPRFSSNGSTLTIDWIETILSPFEGRPSLPTYWQVAYLRG